MTCATTLPAPPSIAAARATVLDPSFAAHTAATVERFHAEQFEAYAASLDGVSYDAADWLWGEFYAHASALGASDTAFEDLEEIATKVSSLLGRAVRAPEVGS